MVRLIPLIIAYMYGVCAQTVPPVVKEQTPQTRSWVDKQNWNTNNRPDFVHREDTRASLLPHSLHSRPPAISRLEPTPKQGPLKTVDEPARMSHWNNGRGIVPPMIPSLARYQSQLYSDWNKARNVLLANLRPLSHSKQEAIQTSNFEDDDSQIARPTLSPQELAVVARWEDAKSAMLSKIRPALPSSQEETEIAEYDDVKNLLLPNNSPDLAKSKQPALTSWHDVNFYPGLSLPSNPKLWKPPAYFQSLKEVHDAMANIKMHFSIDANTPKNDPRYKYIAVVHVIEGLTREVSQYGWDTYNNNYDELVLKLLDNISQHPEETLAEVNCVFEASVKKIQRIKKLMTNQWVDYLCKAQPCVCDTLVYAIVKMSDDEELNQEAELLLLLGLAASDYLDIYSRVFDAISKQNVYLYLKNSKETLRTLIYKNSIARRHSSFSLKDQCYEEHALPQDIS